MLLSVGHGINNQKNNRMTTTVTPPKGYVNGSDVLLGIGDKDPGHCTGHSVTYGTDTKKRAVKPVRTAGFSEGLWQETAVTGLNIKISAKGLRFWEETELTYGDFLKAWHAHEPVDVSAFMRGSDTKPYLKGKFIITSIQEENDSDSDASWSVELENYGAPEVFEPENTGKTAEA